MSLSVTSGEGNVAAYLHSRFTHLLTGLVGLMNQRQGATISVTRHIAWSLYGGNTGAVKDSQPTPVSITDTVSERALSM